MSIAAKDLWAGILLSVVLLSGCGNQAGGQATSVATAEAETEAAVSQILTGKISSINGNEISLYKANNDGIEEVPVATSSEVSSDADVAGQTDTPVVAGENDTVATLQFTDEIITITVSEATKFLQVANTNGQGDGGVLALSDLKAGDIIEVTLNSETLTADSIVVQADKVAGGGISVPSQSPVASPPTQPSPDSSSRPQQSPGAAPGKGQASPPQGAKSGQPPAGDKSSPPAGESGGAAGTLGKTPPTASTGTPSKPTASAKPATSANPTPAPVAPDTAPMSSSGSGDAANVQRGMSFGKIKSISGSTITIYAATAAAAPPQSGVTGGEAAEGAQGTEPQTRPTGEPGAESGPGAGGMPQGGGQPSFSDETTVITVSSSTKLLSVTFDNGTRTDAVITLSTLKAGDVIQYSLKTSTTEAESITLNSGNPAGGK